MGEQSRAGVEENTCVLLWSGRSVHRLVKQSLSRVNLVSMLFYGFRAAGEEAAYLTSKHRLWLLWLLLLLLSCATVGS